MIDEPTHFALLRDSVRECVAPFGFEYFAATSRAKKSPTELWQALGRGGFLGVNIEERYGGGGRGMSELAIVAEEVAASGCPLMLLALSPAVCATILSKHGTNEQRDEWLPALATGERIMGFAITEPDAGSNTHNIRTRAERDGDKWVLTGAKHYVSHVDNADALLVVAGTGVDDRGRIRLAMFIVPTGIENLEQAPLEVDILSPERQYTLHFDGVRLAPDSLVGDIDDGWRTLFAGLNPERIGSAAVVNGISRYLLDRAVRYARDRVVWDVPIGAHQAIAHPLARAHAQVEMARLGTAHAARLYDNGDDTRGDASNLAKLVASEAADITLDAAIQTHGGNGMATDVGISAMWGLVRLFRVAPVSSEMILNHIAQHALGLPRSY
jgi:alkylation response protein AidB-like acyl-CoA dehydrogenase